MKTFTFCLFIFLIFVNTCSAADKAQRTIGVLLFPGFELLDAAGPMEMWGNLKGRITLATVASEKGSIASSQGQCNA